MKALINKQAELTEATSGASEPAPLRAGKREFGAVCLIAALVLS